MRGYRWRRFGHWRGARPLALILSLAVLILGAVTWRLDGRPPRDRDDWAEALFVPGYWPSTGSLVLEPGQPLGTLHEELSSDCDWRRIRLILRNGADPDAPDADGYRPLCIAASSYRPDLVRLLLRYGADPNLPSRYGTTPLMGAASIGDIGVVKRLLRAGARVEVRNIAAATALHYAAWPIGRESPQTIELLITHGAEPNAADAEGMTPLHCAARSGAVASVRALVNHGAASVRDRKGLTPLDEAKRLGRQDVVLLLRNSGGQ